jgi:hypothetical protein
MKVMVLITAHMGFPPRMKKFFSVHLIKKSASIIQPRWLMIYLIHIFNCRSIQYTEGHIPSLLTGKLSVSKP